MKNRKNTPAPIPPHDRRYDWHGIRIPDETTESRNIKESVRLSILCWLIGLGLFLIGLGILCS